MEPSTEKSYYRIREVAEMLDLPPSTLRFWESQFPNVLKPRRNEGHTRFYSPADIDTLRMIKYLIKDKGLKIEAARDAIRRNHSGVSRRSRAVTTLLDVRSRLQGILDALNQLR